MSEQEIMDMFSQHGKVESVKMQQPPKHRGQGDLRALVCFKSPYDASIAKAEVGAEHQYLHISYYEPGEVRDQRNEEQKDKLLQKMFDWLDTDNSGKVTFFEFKVALMRAYVKRSLPEELLIE